MPDSKQRTFRAPGRVNLIGEHTDYNDGFVMPAAIGFSTWATLTPLEQDRIEIYSENFDEEVSVDLNNPPHLKRDHWSDYAVGVVATLLQAGHSLGGCRIVVRGEVPIGSGLSSSAALEVVIATALNAHSNLEIDRVELARVCRRAENEFVGARVGIMDQFVSLFGAVDRALLLDCRSLEHQLLPLSTDAQLVVCNTMVKHALASSAYNERRSQCEEGVRVLREFVPNVTALRDVSVEDLEKYRDKLSTDVFKRCRHIITENDRVLDAAKALNDADFREFGRLMNQSHESLRYDFEVSCEELDVMVEIARTVDGVYGARMTGGGFGGCTVNLVHRDRVEEFKKTVADGYFEATKLSPEIYVCDVVNGAEEI